MTLKNPSTDQLDSLKYFFHVKNSHRDNVLIWLDDCREASIQNVKNSEDSTSRERAVGTLITIDDLINIINKI